MTKEYDLPLEDECEVCFGHGCVEAVVYGMIGINRDYWHKSPCGKCHGEGYIKLKELELEDNE